MDRSITIKRHAALFDDMATQLGMDLQEAAIRGALSFDEISEAVTRCTGCSNPTDCAARLQVTQVAKDAPTYCRNVPLLHRLKAGM
ncbi:hypothetical protein NBRC116594_08420 [Shimia sp. NS0008-38b]|uniref:DUF6455 family protein n=1 Tax=Shimia sp. NS0008-38b TaxID=3127653 RepID=UPI003106F806